MVEPITQQNAERLGYLQALFVVSSETKDVGLQAFMDLTGQLSNRGFQALIQSLTAGP